jgi:hypothetical protein
MEAKYYTPEIREFCIGFEYECNPAELAGGRPNWVKDVVTNAINLQGIETLLEAGCIRVKYLDAQDIEECGFTTDAGEIPSVFTYYKVLPDKTIYQISPYWYMRKEFRENLVRIYKGELHQYPYNEIFRGNIKNKSELKKVLQMLDIK